MLPIYLFGIEARTSDQGRHAGLVQRDHRHTSRCAQASELANQAGKRPVRADLVVTVCRDHHRRDAIESAAGVEQEVGCRIVGPVQVFNEHHSRLLFQRVENCGEKLIARQCGVDLELRCDLDDRPKRSRRRQSIAGAGRNADGHLVQERRDERRLAGARLTTDERERACSRSDVLEVCRQRRELRLALDQLHGRDGKKRLVLRSMACA